VAIRSNRPKIEKYIQNREPFKLASMSGVEGSYLPWGNQLPGDWERVYTTQRAHIVYTVLSYLTPIAWVMDDGQKIMPDEHYSNTTSNHQHIAQMALNVDRS
jgi:hypothetical protein